MCALTHCAPSNACFVIVVQCRARAVRTHTVYSAGPFDHFTLLAVVYHWKPQSRSVINHERYRCQHTCCRSNIFKIIFCFLEKSFLNLDFTLNASHPVVSTASEPPGAVNSSGKYAKLRPKEGKSAAHKLCGKI